MTVPEDLQVALDAYKTNYARYQVGGRTEPAYRTAYENALATANQILANMSSATSSNDVYIQNFITSYENTNSDITALQAQSKEIQTGGPMLQDKLAQVQQLHARKVEVADETSLYVKSAIVFGLLIVVGIMGAL